MGAAPGCNGSHPMPTAAASASASGSMVTSLVVASATLSANQAATSAPVAKAVAGGAERMGGWVGIGWAGLVGVAVVLMG